MASKLQEFEGVILSMTATGCSYASIAKVLGEKGCKTDGPAVYRWLKSRQRKLLARQALVYPTAVPLPLATHGDSGNSDSIANGPTVAPAVVLRQAPNAKSVALEFDKLMEKTTEKMSILSKKLQ